jgi:hypothetical protein
MLAVRLRRVGRAACDYDAVGVNVAGAAHNGVVIVHWIRVCHECSLSMDEVVMNTVMTVLMFRAWRIR